MVSGRFGVVLGGSKNTASGRHSAAMGYGAVAGGDYSLTACFTGDQCVNNDDNTIAFFADNMFINDVNLNDILPDARRLLSTDAVDALSKAQDVVDQYSLDYELLVAEVETAIAHQESLYQAVAGKLS